MSELSQGQREDLRHAIMRFLASAPRLAFSAAGLATVLERKGWLDFHPSEADIAEACLLLLGLEHVTELADDYGATKAYRATAQGILVHERRSQDP